MTIASIIYALVAHEVEFIVVGMAAVCKGAPVHTIDLDLVSVRSIGRAAMRHNKLAAPRPKDLLDRNCSRAPTTDWQSCRQPDAAGEARRCTSPRRAREECCFEICDQLTCSPPTVATMRHSGSITALTLLPGACGGRASRLAQHAILRPSTTAGAALARGMGEPAASPRGEVAARLPRAAVGGLRASCAWSGYPSRGGNPTLPELRCGSAIAQTREGLRKSGSWSTRSGISAAGTSEGPSTLANARSGKSPSKDRALPTVFG